MVYRVYCAPKKRAWLPWWRVSLSQLAKSVEKGNGSLAFLRVTRLFTLIQGWLNVAFFQGKPTYYFMLRHTCMTLRTWVSRLKTSQNWFARKIFTFGALCNVPCIQYVLCINDYKIQGVPTSLRLFLDINLNGNLQFALLCQNVNKLSRIFWYSCRKLVWTSGMYVWMHYAVIFPVELKKLMLKKNK